jgi:hypothetical protein
MMVSPPESGGAASVIDSAFRVEHAGGLGVRIRRESVDKATATHLMAEGSSKEHPVFE